MNIYKKILNDNNIKYIINENNNFIFELSDANTLESICNSIHDYYRDKYLYINIQFSSNFMDNNNYDLELWIDENLAYKLDKNKELITPLQQADLETII